MESAEIIDTFADTDIAHRRFQLVAQTEDYAALCCAIKFGEDNARNFKSFTEKFGLGDGVLTGICIEYENGFVGCTRHCFGGNTSHFFEFVEQVYLGV